MWDIDPAAKRWAPTEWSVTVSRHSAPVIWSVTVGSVPSGRAVHAVLLRRA